MRLPPLLLCLFVLGICLSGCGGGGSDTSAETIPAAPALTVPGNESAPPITTATTGATGATGTEPSSSGGAAPSSGTPSSGTPSSSQGTGQQQSSSPSGGAQAPSSNSGGSGSTTTPSNGGTPPGEFNKFCKENPGAC
jgi:hypothetical protein